MAWGGMNSLLARAAAALISLSANELPPAAEAERQLRLGNAGAALAIAEQLRAEPQANAATRAEAEVLRGRSLDRLGRCAEAQTVFAAAAERYRSNPDPKARYQAVGALVELGSAEQRRGDLAAADAAWRLAEQRFGADSDRSVRETANAATLARVMTRAEAGDVNGARTLAAEVTAGIAPDASADRIELRDMLLSMLTMLQMAGPMMERPPAN